ncbi:MAG TPA: LPS assembly protein LptD [Kiritimatiellia bacterium]|nr:LPS assembly protein LptD [Kiritimatiellia bacterium]HMP34602.1 LPS assembly protein LptD [Kiritimatiellia bacterium]
MPRSMIAGCFALVAALLATLPPTFAQSKAQERPPLDIVADSLDYFAEKNLMVGTGNVEVRDRGDVLTADYMSVQTETMDVYARGNVIYRRGDNIWRGEELRYNLKTRTGDFGSFSMFFDPFYVTAEDSKRVATNEYVLNGVIITTCEGDDPAVSIHAREARIKDNRVYTKGATFYAFGFLPYLYLPSYSRSLDSHERFFQLVPGYSSRLGAFMLTAYNYRLAENLRGITHLDYRSKRGVGVGQDFVWKDRENDTYNGMIQGYYLNDDDPLRGPDSENRTEDIVDEERYRIRLTHFHEFSDRDFLLADANYLSDPFILQDFFNREYRNQVQPENRVTLTHRGDDYTAAIGLNKRLNDFYENVDRLPELTLDVPRKQIDDSGFYFESRSAASYLERVFPEDPVSGDPVAEDYDSFRIDSANTIYYPTRHFGFLNIIPRAGYRGTYYSETLSSSTVTNTAIVDDGAGNITVTTNTVSSILDEGADLRNVYQLGWEGSFKAFRTWDDYIVMGDGDGLRHVAEPYLDHTFQPRPNLTPDELPQFDSIDTIDKRHDIKLGMRNKLQTRRVKQPVDLIDLNVYTFYRVEKEDDEEDFSEIFWDADMSLVPWLLIEFDGSYDPYESEVETFSTQVSYLMDDLSRVGLEYRYRLDQQSLGGLVIDLFPQDRWSFNSSFRMDFEEDELEEQSYFIRRTGQCIGWGLGFRQVDDDEQVWLQLWLTAFPGTMIDVGY